jgi:hypothetical protein
MLKLTKPDANFWIMVQGANILVRPMSLSEEERIKRNHREYDRKGRVFTGKEFVAKLQKVIRDWDENVADMDGNPLPCTAENVKMLAEQETGVAAEILAQTEQIDGSWEPASQGSETMEE